MVGGEAACCRAGGDEDIQAPRPSRLIAAAGALAAYGTAGFDALTRDRAHVLVYVPGVALGALCLAVALARWEQVLGLALGLCGATYIAEVAVKGGGVDNTAPLVAVLLLLCGELTAWSLAERGKLRVDDAVHGTRALSVFALAVAGLLGAGIVVALGTVQLGGGLLWTAVGAAAAVGAAGGAAVLARR